MAPRSRAFRLLGIVLIAVALLIALYTAVAYIGLQSGRTLREERLQQERATEFSTQMERARQDMDGGNFALAARRLQWILEQDPNYPQARQLLVEAETGRDGAPLTGEPPGARPPNEESEATATRTPEETDDEPSSGEEAPPAAAMRRAEQLMENEAWEEAITALIALQHNYPDYERRQTDEMLYEAYVKQGVELLYGDQIELGLYYLEQAEHLGDLPQDVRDQQQWAELYLAGMGYFGVNWEVALFYFRDLCLAAPFFHDACARLTESLVAYGDQYAVQQEWCPARDLYEEAYRQEASDSIAQKLQQARQRCAEATPTPAAPISGTLPVTGTVPLTATNP